MRCPFPRSVASLFCALLWLLSTAPAPAAEITWSPADFGAKLDGIANDRAALQQAIDTAHAAGGGTVIIPAGRVLLTGSFALKSHVTLHLAPGSRILASLNPADYTAPILVGAAHAEDIAITGTGVIDGRARDFMAEETPDIFKPKPWRPRLMLIEDCRRVQLRDFTIRDGAMWTVHLAGCDGVLVRGLTILNNLKIPNCDGIDPDCSRNVTITDCHIEAGDDCIVLKTSREFARYGACENIVVSNCILTTRSTALKIGTETVNDIRNVVFTNCIVRDSHRAVGIWLRDAGSIENVIVSNIVSETRLYPKIWWGSAEAIYVSARARTAGAKIGTLRGLRFSHIIGHGEAGVFIQGSPECIPEDIHLDDVTVTLAKTTTVPSRHDVRPPDSRGVAEDIVIAGIHLEDARDVALRDCTVNWGASPPKNYGPALRALRVADFRNEGFRGTDAHAP
jgi:polygalacturonase